MPETNIAFAKIVANPTPYSWSQAYNSGKLFAVLSVERNEEESLEKDALNILGKGILDNLEQEYYSLETKDLDSIKNAVLVTSKKIPEDIFSSFVICAIINNLLYVFILGKGKVDIKRGGKLGTILQVDEDIPSSVKAASGYLQDKDVIVLQTKQFSDLIPSETVAAAIDHQPPSEIAETLAPKIHGHEKDQSGAAAVILSYKEPEEKEEVLETETETKKPKEDEKIKEDSFEEGENEMPLAPVELSFPRSFSIEKVFSPILKLLKVPRIENINHSKKLILTVVAIIAVIFVISAFLTIKKQNDAKVAAMFNQVYPKAQKKYDEGQSLLGLNQNLAFDSFTASKKILEDGKSKFAKDSTQEKQILSLLSKVDSALSSSSGINQTSAQNVDEKLSPILSLEAKTQGVTYAVSDDKNIYYLNPDGISSVSKNKGEAKVIIKPSELPKNIGGLGIYFGNIYVLDKDGKQINKFVQTSGGFAKADYFVSAVTPDLSSATSIAIDGSIWILFKNGTIEKFTKGKADSFSVTGLQKGFSNALRISTNVDSNNVYVLDQGNSRIVVLDKNGAYKAQYQEDILKNAMDFDVLEKDKKVYVLSLGKVFEINLK